MPLNITGQNIDITDSIRDYITVKFDKINQHTDNITNTNVVLNVEKNRHQVEANLQATGTTIHASAEADDMYSAIDQMVDKIDRQVIKHKEKTSHNHR